MCSRTLALADILYHPIKYEMNTTFVGNFYSNCNQILQRLRIIPFNSMPIICRAYKANYMGDFLIIETFKEEIHISKTFYPNKYISYIHVYCECLYIGHLYPGLIYMYDS